MNVSDGYRILYESAGNLFASMGFHPNKRRDLYIRTRAGLTDSFCVRLSKKSNGQLWHHLTLEFLNEEVQRLLSIVENKSRLSLGLDSIAGKRSTCSVTDWTSIYQEIGQEPGKLWFANFEDIKSGNAISSDYELMIQLGKNWFDSIHNTDALLHYCLQSRYTYSFQVYLTVIKIHKPNALTKAFDQIVVGNAKYLGWDKDELVAFYRFLKAESVTAN